MKKFDIDNSLSPELILSALVSVENKIFEVINMTKSSITLKDHSGKEKIIYQNSNWNPIPLNNDWLLKFGLSESSLIRNTRTQTDWIIKKTDSGIYYLTIKNDFSLGENPIIPLSSVHMFQLWFELLTEITLTVDNLL